MGSHLGGGVIQYMNTAKGQTPPALLPQQGFENSFSYFHQWARRPQPPKYGAL